VKEVALIFAERAEKYFQCHICTDLLQKHSDSQHTDLVKRRLMNTGLLPKDKPDQE
jgi:hypothetical protein